MQSSTRLLPGYLQLQISEIGWAHCTPPRPSCSRYPCQPNSLDETHVLDVDKHSVTVFVALGGACVKADEKAAGGHFTGRGQLNRMRKFTTTFTLNRYSVCLYRLTEYVLYGVQVHTSTYKKYSVV